MKNTAQANVKVIQSWQKQICRTLYQGGKSGSFLNDIG